ncbi:MAG: phosphotransferase enzyme family protein [Planctomycetota bacterium]|jgi:Ser/Thr protein kinase RdoA (MazF antagonist)
MIGIAKKFSPEGQVLDVQEYGAGNLNDTFLVTLNGGPAKHFILQRVNTRVFRRPQLIVRNLRTFSDHVRKRLACEVEGTNHRWVVPYLLPAQDGKDYYVDAESGFWRALSFVPHSTCYQTVQSADHAREAGYALGRFHGLISDLDVHRLHDTLEGFHITPGYLRHYDRVLKEHAVADVSPEVRHCMRFVQARREWAFVLEEAKERGELIVRPIHGDPKVDNIMVDRETGRAISIVDLDTVKPGLVHYDIGDCLRSCCNLLGEETEQVDDVHFETDLCRAILGGYLGEARQFLAESDCAYLYDAIRLIAFELGLRFFTDYLEGNVYFKVRHGEHNLVRALVQFQLARSVEEQEVEIRAIIEELCADRLGGDPGGSAGSRQAGAGYADRD